MVVKVGASSSNLTRFRGSYSKAGLEGDRHHFTPPRATGKRTLFLGSQSPWTSGLSSSRSSVQRSARDFPRESSSRKKLTPRSASVTVASSTIVNLPIPVTYQHLALPWP